MRPPALLVVAAILVSSVAVADPVGYGYVTHVELPAYNPDVTRHGCSYDVALPKTRLDHAPHGTHPELLVGATQAIGADDDPDGTCYQLEHTWQPVAFDRLHHYVQIAMPPFTGIDFTAWFVRISAALLILPWVFRVLFGARYKRWRDGRYDRRRERNARKLAGIRERIANTPPARLPRAEVVDRGERSKD